MGNPINYALAEGLAAGSVLAERFPKTAARILDTGHPLQVPALWRRGRRQNVGKFEPTDPWMEFEGDATCDTVFPSGFKRVAIMTAGNYAIDRSAGQQAVAYVLGGSEVMIGTAREASAQLFDEDPNNSQRYSVGMLVGKEALWASMGKYDESTGVFTPKTDHISYSSRLVVDLADVRVNFAG